MSSRKAPDEDVARLTPRQRAAYDVVIAAEEAGYTVGVGEALKAAGIPQSHWNSAHQRLSFLRDKREREAREGLARRALVEDDEDDGHEAGFLGAAGFPERDKLKATDPINLAPEQRQAIKALREEVKAEKRHDKLLRRAQTDALVLEPPEKRTSPIGASRVDCAAPMGSRLEADALSGRSLPVGTLGASSRDRSLSPTASLPEPVVVFEAIPPKESQMPSPAREDAALATVLYAVRRLPLGERKRVLEAAILMSGAGVNTGP